MLSTSFFQKLAEVCGRLGIKPANLLLVMFLESGVNPAQKNKAGGSAVGLIQFMPDTLKSMGLDENTIKNFDKVPAEKQLDYVEQYVRGAMNKIGNKPFTSATQYYHANIFPLTLSRWSGDDPKLNRNVVVFSSRSKDARERAAYKYNGKYFDTDNKGYVSVGDLSTRLNELKNTTQFKNILSQFINSTQNIPKEYNEKNEVENDKVDNFIQNFISQFKEANNYLLNISSTGDLSCSLEFARILCLALKENLNAKTNIHLNNNEVEITCRINSEKNIGYNKIKKLSSVVIEDFKNATKKLGNTDYFITCIADSKSELQEIDIKTAEINFRKFHLKFLRD
jgi:hypothetical protein